MTKKPSKKKSKKLPLTQRMKVWHLAAIFGVLAVLIIGGIIFRNINERNRKIAVLKELSSLFDDIQADLKSQGIKLEKEEYCGAQEFKAYTAPQYCGVVMTGEVQLSQKEYFQKVIDEHQYFSIKETLNEFSEQRLYEYKNTGIDCLFKFSDPEISFHCTAYVNQDIFPE